jgi:hypothetical protein
VLNCSSKKEMSHFFIYFYTKIDELFMATSKRPLCMCVAQVRGKVSGKDESLLIVGVGWALSLNTGTIAS